MTTADTRLFHLELPADGEEVRTPQLVRHREIAVADWKRFERYVLAALSTARGELTVRLDGRLVSRWRFPINEHVVQPLHPRGG